MGHTIGINEMCIWNKDLVHVFFSIIVAQNENSSAKVSEVSYFQNTDSFLIACLNCNLF
jgi:hypothetical protein